MPEDLLDHPQLGAALDGVGARFYVTSVEAPLSTEVISARFVG